MTENEIKNTVKTINAQLENALQKEKETEGTENTVIWHLVANDYKCAIKALEEIRQYRAIGTVRECREARERQMRRKPVKDEYGHSCCPGCGWIVYHDEWGGRYLPHCENCGQALDWDN